MKNTLFAAFLLLSVSAFGQTPDTKPQIKLTQPPTQERNRQVPSETRVFFSSGDTPVKPTIPPLLVLDSVITHFKDYTAFQDKLNEINPNDIQSIDVLKDKMAVEKFGEQGLHGVIIVTLKKVGSKN